MSSERVERVREGYAAFNRGDLGAVLEGVADDVTWEVLDVFPEQEEVHGKDGILRFWQSWAETFSEFRAEVEEIIEAGDHVIVVMHMTGRARGSENPMRTPTFVQIWTFGGGQVTRSRMVADLEEAWAIVGGEP
jgi:ketosteroid isomerase-like protein